MSMYEKNSENKPSPKIIACTIVFLLALCMSLMACGKGPYEQCLGQEDCANGQNCQAGKCVQAPSPEKPVAQAEPKSEPAKPEPQPEVITPDASYEEIPEATEKPQPEKPQPEKNPEKGPEKKPGCTQDLDCRNGQICQGGACVKDNTCIPIKYDGFYQHMQDIRNAKSIRYTADKKRFYLNAKDVMQIHDATTGQVKDLVYFNNTKVSQTLMSPDGKWAVGHTYEYAEKNVYAKRILVYSIALKRVLYKKDSPIVTFSPDSKHLIILESSNLVYLDPATGLVAKKLPLTGLVHHKTGHTQLSRNGKYIVQINQFMTLNIWNVATGKKEKSFNIQDKPSYFGIVGFISDDLFVAHLRDKQSQAITTIFSISKGKKVGSFSGAANILAAHPSKSLVLFWLNKKLYSLDLQSPTNTPKPTNAVFSPFIITTAMAYHPNGKTFLVNAYNQGKIGYLQMLSADTYKPQTYIPYPGKEGLHFQFHPQQEWLMTYSLDGLTRSWDLNPKVKMAVPSHLEIKLFPSREFPAQYKTGLVIDSEWKHAVSYDRKTVQLWDVSKGSLIKVLENRSAYKNKGIRRAAFGLKNGFFINLFEGLELASWNLQTLKGQKVPAPQNGNYKPELIGVHSQNGWIATLLLTSKYEQTLSVWDPKTLQKKWSRPYSGYIWSATLAPTKELIAVHTRKRTVEVIDLSSGRVLYTLSVKSGVGTMAFSPDSNTLAIRSGSELKVLDTKTWKVLSTLPLTSTNIFAIHPSNRSIAVANITGNIEVYDTYTGKLKGTISGKNSKSIAVIRYSPSGRKVAFSSKGDSIVHVWSCTAP